MDCHSALHDPLFWRYTVFATILRLLNPHFVSVII